MHSHIGFQVRCYHDLGTCSDDYPYRTDRWTGGPRQAIHKPWHGRSVHIRHQENSDVVDVVLQRCAAGDGEDHTGTLRSEIRAVMEDAVQP